MKRIFILVIILIGVLFLVSQRGKQESSTGHTPSTLPNQNAKACSVKELKMIGEGIVMDWSHSNNLLVYNKSQPNSIVPQLYISNPDGANEQCLTCATKPAAPALDRYKGFPSWYPSGEWVVLPVEMENHTQPSLITPSWQKHMMFLNGWWANLYVTDRNGDKWYQLTDYSSGVNVEGALFPHFSHNGQKLVWSKLVGRPDKDHPFGFWKLYLADFVVHEGVPRLANVQDITPSGGSFYETSSFTLDDKKIIFAADIGTTSQGFDIFVMDLATRRIKNLTNTPDQWDEHAFLSPTGEKIAFISTTPYKHTGSANMESLKTELMLMDADGTNVQQLTNFNTKGYREYSSKRTIPAASTWSPDGTRIIFMQILTGGEFLGNRNFWELSFEGNCG